MSYQNEGLGALASGLVLSPFTRTRRLLADIEPGMPPLDMTIGEPREEMPGFVVERIEAARAAFAKYPPIRGSEELRKSIGQWLGRRFNLGDTVDFLREVHPTNGSREGLFYAALPAVGRRTFPERPAVLLPNPYY